MNNFLSILLVLLFSCLLSCLVPTKQIIVPEDNVEDNVECSEKVIEIKTVQIIISSDKGQFWIIYVDLNCDNIPDIAYILKYIGRDSNGKSIMLVFPPLSINEVDEFYDTFKQEC